MASMSKHSMERSAYNIILQRYGRKKCGSVKSVTASRQMERGKWQSAVCFSLHCMMHAPYGARSRWTKFIIRAHDGSWWSSEKRFHACETLYLTINSRSIFDFFCSTQMQKSNYIVLDTLLNYEFSSQMVLIRFRRFSRSVSLKFTKCD